MSNAPRLQAAKRDWGHDETGCTTLHIDMDAFFASLEIARNPQLEGRPVIIGTGPRSVVSAASYEARRYGVNSAMATARARQLCPGGVFLPVDMAYYRSMSRRIFSEVLSSVTDRIEQVSVDEGYMDVSSALLMWKLPTSIARWIRAEVHRRFHITCSVGIASNKLVAKIASTNAKPDGMLLIPRSRQAQFVQMMPLRAIAGIGPSLEKKLNAWGVDSVRDLACLSEEALFQATGSRAAAAALHQASLGHDERRVTVRAPEKSIGSESTFPQDTRNVEQVESLLARCCDDVATTLRARGLMTRTITVKLRFADLSYATKSRTESIPVDAASAILPIAVFLLRTMTGMGQSTGVRSLPRDIRLAGVSASNLSDRSRTVVQPSLDDVLEETSSAHGNTRSARLREAEQALDAVRKRYGKKAADLGLR
ncbi:MAG: DNA polymerase IV [Bifidobacterium sp.]|jgi:DNA polymerase-4|nr:DNA polymerase IV [Bifidobacterium sp.]